MKAVTGDGIAEVYSSLFPDIEGAAGISMWHHRVGLTTLYYYVNNSSSDELREALDVTLDNQAVLMCDETDETLVSSPSSLLPRCKDTVSHEVVLKPGESALYLHRPCSSDGASSSVARSCNIVSHLTPDVLMEMCKAKGEVVAHEHFALLIGCSRRCRIIMGCPASASTRCSTRPCTAFWWKTAPRPTR